jgi:hypothetical protein
MMVLSDTIDVAELPESIRSPELVTTGVTRGLTDTVAPPSKSALTASMLEDTERSLIADALAKYSHS